MRTDTDRLLDIREAIRHIEEKLPKTRGEFASSDLHQVWVLYHIQVIGEAANGISPEFQARYPAIPWKDMIAMRNLLVHHYFGIDIGEVWVTAKNDLPSLKTQIERILRQE